MVGLHSNTCRVLRLLPALVLVACTESTAPDVSDPPDEIVCTEITLDRDHGVPLDVVVLSDLPDSFGEGCYVEVTVEGSDNTGVAPVLWRGDEPRMLAPLHPVDVIDGGAVVLTFVNAEERCGPIAFTVDPLPEAPGAFAAALEDLRGVIGAWASANGTDPDAWLAADPATLETHEIGYLLAHDVISNLDNPNAVPYLLDGTAPVLAEESADIDFLDRLTARTGLRSVITGVRGGIDALPPFPVAARRGDGAGCIDIPDAAALDLFMSAAALGVSESTGASADVLEATGAAVGMVGAIVPYPPVKLAGLALGNLAWGHIKTAEAMAGLFPSALGELGFFAFPTEFNEDDPGPGEWSDVVVTATSTGWSADKLVLEAILRYTRTRASLGVTLTGQGSVETGLTIAASSEVGNAIIGALDTDVLAVDPCTWTVNVTGPEWTTSVVTGDAIVADDDALEYRPVAAGESLLRIETRTDRFGDAFAASSVLVRVKAIEVTVTPVEVFVDPGDIVLYTAVVECANDPSVAWAASAGDVDETVPGAAAYSTPFDESLYPILITATSTAEGGARDDPDAIERVGTAIVRLNGSPGLAILPGNICVDRGETLTFTVVASEGDPPPVSWSVNPAAAGSFSGNDFTAADADFGEVTITATSLDDPTMIAETTITVQHCACSWSATASGAFGGTWSGEVIEWSNLPGTTSFMFRVANDGPPLFPFGFFAIDRILAEGEIGTFAAAGAFAASEAEFAEAGDETGGTVAITLTRNQNGIMQGSVIGTLVVDDGGEVLPVAFNMSFIARTPTIEHPQPCRNDP